MLGLMSGSAPKGIKSQAPCVMHVQLQHWGLGVQHCCQRCFGGTEQSLNFLQPHQGPQSPEVMLQGAGWLEPGLEQLWLQLRGSGAWAVLGSTRRQQRGPGEAEGAGRGLGGDWVASGEGWPADPGESRGEGR